MLKLMTIKKNLLMLTLSTLTAMLGVSGCSNDVSSKAEFPDKVRDKTYENGSLLSDKGGFDLLGGDKTKDQATGITVNAYLWRAALDTVSFMPLLSADPFGGVILTDWYSSANSKERLKLTVLILDRVLRADGIKVKAFKQTMTSKGNWRDEAVDPTVATKLEDAILTRARQLKLGQ
jgi:hypothetical protein